MAHRGELARATSALHHARERFRRRALDLSLVPVDSQQWYPAFEELQALSADVVTAEGKVDTLVCDELLRLIRPH